jgi:hypothetical protein
MVQNFSCKVDKACSMQMNQPQKRLVFLCAYSGVDLAPTTTGGHKKAPKRRICIRWGLGTSLRDHRRAWREGNPGVLIS